MDLFDIIPNQGAQLYGMRPGHVPCQPKSQGGDTSWLDGRISKVTPETFAVQHCGNGASHVPKCDGLRQAVLQGFLPNCNPTPPRDCFLSRQTAAFQVPDKLEWAHGHCSGDKASREKDGSNTSAIAKPVSAATAHQGCKIQRSSSTKAILQYWGPALLWVLALWWHGGYQGRLGLRDLRGLRHGIAWKHHDLWMISINF